MDSGALRASSKSARKKDGGLKAGHPAGSSEPEAVRFLINEEDEEPDLVDGAHARKGGGGDQNLRAREIEIASGVRGISGEHGRGARSAPRLGGK